MSCPFANSNVTQLQSYLAASAISQEEPAAQTYAFDGDANIDSAATTVVSFGETMVSEPVVMDPATAAAADQHKVVYYSDYLRVPELLDLVHPESRTRVRPGLDPAGGPVEAHDEHLFIVVHQAHELWFKQALHDLRSAIDIIGAPTTSAAGLTLATRRINRCRGIMDLCITKLNILKSMDPLEFLEFRDLLMPASGFQSAQFRILENLTGLNPLDRLDYQRESYLHYFSDDDRKRIIQSEQDLNLFQALNKWLERCPALGPDGDQAASQTDTLWNSYEQSVHSMLTQQRKTILDDKKISDEHREHLLTSLKASEDYFKMLIDADEYASVSARSDATGLPATPIYTMTHRALKAAVLVKMFYPRVDQLSAPHQLLNAIVELDMSITRWRFSHSQMVQMMIGSRPGTGGSSGYQYLRSTLNERYATFKDLVRIPTFMLTPDWAPSNVASVAGLTNFAGWA
ncbi:hypothetical protein H696_02007 [Fonticula alba]|uniref:Tryptophan 2,3-dioxygenase n=1 Tax=Fonticula alba TaxID=691883 RepID=A0A058ZC94_FONAL|nr:hypothetical protein H696_02007 [Fonticula alba]KCV71057.1 hypothetical protein H696_02007 [Fonticula alba]|eukprot:XP_009494180.1 hypothetical protein H696_02007 [Fonticula alba]